MKFSEYLIINEEDLSKYEEMIHQEMLSEGFFQGLKNFVRTAEKGFHYGKTFINSVRSKAVVDLFIRKIEGDASTFMHDIDAIYDRFAHDSVFVATPFMQNINSQPNPKQAFAGEVLKFIISTMQSKGFI